LDVPRNDGRDDNGLAATRHCDVQHKISIEDARFFSDPVVI